MTDQGGQPERKTCFVVQGFGKKTDFQTGRVLDLDKSYAMIKLAVEAAGLACTRADEIPHSGSIDRVMYERILDADVVVADLSTANVNAAYELGIRHALRPRTTIVVAEDQLKFPFDLNHIVIRPYRHLGEDVGFEEVLRFKDEIGAAIREILEGGDVDSPVYTFLGDLQPPTRTDGGEATTEAPQEEASPQAASTRALMDAAAAAQQAGEWKAARDILTGVRALRPNDSYVVQQLALATYRAEEPTPEEALAAAERLLGEELDPAASRDPATLELWAAIRTRLWDLTQDPEHLATALAAREGTWHMRGDPDDGITLAFLLNLRATRSEPADAIADWVLAGRVRRNVAAAAEAALADAQPDARFRLLAILWEAAVGLGDGDSAARWEAEARTAAADEQEITDTETHIANLRALLTKSPLGLITEDG